MKDYSELKRLSEAATPGPWFDDDGFVRAESGLDIVESCSGCPMRPNDTAFVSAANPAVVLALIAEAERLETQFKEWQASHHSNYCMVADERDELKAEIEALRQDAKRYRWLRKTESWEDAMMGIRDLWIVSSREEVANTDGEYLDAAIDAAMSNETDHD